ncbi:hypothetical protein EYC80_002337 [Monilinia laxa]|uniref:Uncharacterized protein n=1 Tax=Monilinia laxa TaxID=61186 RepID=A0A5N6K3R0_MONLA|nr:hypothetical protein EYC80_002337 [Monilinia laxa]
MVDNILSQLEAMGRKLWSEGTRLSVFWYFYEFTFDRLQKDGPNLPESVHHLRAQVETWKYFWPNEDFLAGIFVDNLGTLPTGPEVQNQDTSLTRTEQNPQGLTLVHDAPVFLDEIHQRRHPDRERSFSAPIICSAQSTASYGLLASLEPVHPLPIEQHPLQQDTIPLASQQLLSTEQQSPQQDEILKRNRRPPICWKWDYRDIAGFWESDSRPWTWQFSLEQASNNQNKSSKARNRPHDSKWNDPDEITSQAYPGDQRAQDSNQEKEPIPIEGIDEDDEKICQSYLSLLPDFKESLDHNSILLCENFNEVINPNSKVSEGKKTFRAKILRLAIRLGETAVLEKQQASGESLTTQQTMKIAKKESRELEFETLINAYHEPSQSPQMYTTMEKGKGKDESSLPLATEESFNKAADAADSSLNPVQYASFPGTIQPPGTMLPPGTMKTPGMMLPPRIISPPRVMYPPGITQHSRIMQHPGIMQPQGVMQTQGAIQHPELSQDLQAHHYSFKSLIAKSQFGANLTSAPDHRNLNSESVGPDESTDSSGKGAPICVPQETRRRSNKFNPNMNASGELLAIPKWHIEESKEQKAIKNKIQKLAKEIKDIESFVAKGELLSNQQLQRAEKKKEKEEELTALSSTYYQPSLPPFGEEPYTSTNVLPATTSSSCEFPPLSAKSEAAGSSPSISTTSYSRKVGQLLPKLKHIDRRKSQKTASEEESWPSLSGPAKETSPQNIGPGTARSSSSQSKHAESSPKINVRPWPSFRRAQETSMFQSATTSKSQESKPLINTQVKRKDGFAASNEIQPSLITKNEMIPALTYAQRAARFNNVSQPVATSKSLKLKNLNTPDAKSQEDFPALNNVQASPVASITSGTYPSYSQKASSLNKTSQSTTASLNPKELRTTGAEIQDEFPPLSKTQTPPLRTIQRDSPSSYARKASEAGVVKQDVTKQDSPRPGIVASKFSKSITFENAFIQPKEQQAKAYSSETQISNESSMIAQKMKSRSGSNEESLSSPKSQFREVIPHENTGSYTIPQRKKYPSISDPRSRSIIGSKLQESGPHNTKAYVIPQKLNFLGTQGEKSQTSDQTVPNMTSPNPKGKSPGTMGAFFYEGPRSREYFVSQTSGSGSSVPPPSTQPDIANSPHSPSTSVRANRAREFISTTRPPGSTRRRCSSLPPDPYLEVVNDTHDAHDTHDNHDTSDAQDSTPPRSSNLQQKETRTMRRPQKRRSLSSSEIGGPNNLAVLFSGGRIQPLSPSLFKHLRGSEKKNCETLSSSSVSKTNDSKEINQSPTSEHPIFSLQTQFNTAPPITSSGKAIGSPEISPLTTSFPNPVVSSSQEPTMSTNVFEHPHSDSLLPESARLDDFLLSDTGSDDPATASLHLSQLKSPAAFELDYSSDGSEETLEAEPDNGQAIPLSSSSDDSVEFILSYEAGTARRSRQRTLHHGIRGEQERNRAEHHTVYGPEILPNQGPEGATAGERAGTISGHDPNSQIHGPTQTAGTEMRQRSNFEEGLRNMLLRPSQNSTLPASPPTQVQIDRNVGIHNVPDYFSLPAITSAITVNRAILAPLFALCLSGIGCVDTTNAAITTLLRISAALNVDHLVIIIHPIYLLRDITSKWLKLCILTTNSCIHFLPTEYTFLIHTIHLSQCNTPEYPVVLFSSFDPPFSIPSTTSTVNFTGRPTTHFSITSPPPIHPSSFNHQNMPCIINSKKEYEMENR